MTDDDIEDILLYGPTSLQSAITIRVYVGGDTSAQYEFMKSAQMQFMQKYSEHNVIFEYINNKYIKDNEMTPFDFVNYMLNSHIHMIIAHPLIKMVKGAYNPRRPWNSHDARHQLQR